MINRLKKGLALLLSLALCMSVSPVTVSAAEAAPDTANDPELVILDDSQEAQTKREELFDGILKEAAEESEETAGLEAVEDGEMVTVSRRVPVDIAFVLDSTGSMWGEIDHVKSEIKEFLDHLYDYNKRISEESDEHIGIDPRIAIIDFKDVTCYDEKTIFHQKEDGGYWFGKTDTEDDGDELITAVDEIIVTGGGDGPETPTEALAKLYKADDGVEDIEGFEWRKDSQKFAFLVTDADFKERRNSSIIAIPDMSEVTEELSKRNIHTSVVTYSYYDSESYYKNLYAETLGKWYDLSGDLDFMEEIIEYFDTDVDITTANVSIKASGAPDGIGAVQLVRYTDKDGKEIAEPEVVYSGDDIKKVSVSWDSTIDVEIRANEAKEGTETEGKKYVIDEVTINGEPQDIPESDRSVYTIDGRNISADTTIQAVFKENPEKDYNLTVHNVFVEEGGLSPADITAYVGDTELSPIKNEGEKSGLVLVYPVKEKDENIRVKVEPAKYDDGQYMVKSFLIDAPYGVYMTAGDGIKASEEEDDFTQELKITRLTGDTDVYVFYEVKKNEGITVLSAEGGTVVLRRYLDFDTDVFDGEVKQHYEYDPVIVGTKADEGQEERKTYYFGEGSEDLSKDISHLFEFRPDNGYELDGILVGTEEDDLEADPEYTDKREAEIGGTKITDVGYLYYAVGPDVLAKNIKFIKGIFKKKGEKGSLKSYITKIGRGTVTVSEDESIKIEKTPYRVDNVEFTYNPGDTRSFVITPDKESGGYVENLTWDDKDLLQEEFSSVHCVSEDGIYYVKADFDEDDKVSHTLLVEFDDNIDPYVITAESEDNGNIYEAVEPYSDKYNDKSKEGEYEVDPGETRTFIIRPDSGFIVEDVLVDGVSVYGGKDEKLQAVSSNNTGSWKYTFENIQKSHTLNATYAEIVEIDGGDTYLAHWTKSVSYDGRKHDWVGKNKKGVSENKKTFYDIEITLYKWDGKTRTPMEASVIKKVKFKNNKYAAEADDSKGPYFTVKLDKSSGYSSKQIKEIAKHKFGFDINQAEITADNLNVEKWGKDGDIKKLSYKIPGSTYTAKMKFTKNTSKSDYIQTPKDGGIEISCPANSNFTGTVLLKK